MNQPNIEPHRITKPIQLLAAWLAGLAVVNSSFLLAASHITSPSWVPAMLAIAAVANVPLFILSLFLLQTKFRPEMQEDSFYSRYLEYSYSKTNSPEKAVDIEAEVRSVAERVVSQISRASQPDTNKIEAVLKDVAIKSLQKRFELNRTISELYLFGEKFEEVVKAWAEDPTFQEEVRQLTSAGLAAMEAADISSLRLTHSGTEVAKRIEAAGRLWHSRHKRTLESRKSDKG